MIVLLWSVAPLLISVNRAHFLRSGGYTYGGIIHVDIYLDI